MRGLWLLLLLLAAPAGALTRAELDRVGAAPPPGATLEPGFGLPTVLIFADVDCGALCDAILGQTAAALADTGAAPGRDYALAVVSLDPRDDRTAADAFVAAQVPVAQRAAVRLMQPDAEGLARISDTLGHVALYDPGTDSFAHAAARYVLSSDGRVTAVVPAISTAAEALGTALAEAAGARAPGPIERLVLLCYGFDPTTGRYSASILKITMVLAILTALALGGGIAVALSRERSRR